MIIRIPMRFEGSKRERNLYALIVALYSCIHEEIAEELKAFTNLHTCMITANASILDTRV